MPGELRPMLAIDSCIATNIITSISGIHSLKTVLKMPSRLFERTILTDFLRLVEGQLWTQLKLLTFTTAILTMNSWTL